MCALLNLLLLTVLVVFMWPAGYWQIIPQILFRFYPDVSFYFYRGCLNSYRFRSRRKDVIEGNLYTWMKHKIEKPVRPARKFPNDHCAWPTAHLSIKMKRIKRIKTATVSFQNWFFAWRALKFHSCVDVDRTQYCSMFVCVCAVCTLELVRWLRDALDNAGLF